MKKISVKDLIEFRTRSDRGKKAFAESIKSIKIEPSTEGGGDYWVTSLSAICNAFKGNDFTKVDEKIEELQEKLNNTTNKITKDMYQRNISNLQQYKTMNQVELRPLDILTMLKKSTGNQTLTIKGFQIQSKPSHIFSFGKKGEEKIGAIWFTSKVGGYRSEEVGLFCELLHCFLEHNYSKKYQIEQDYCIAVDVVSGRAVKYSALGTGVPPQILAPTLDELQGLI